MNLYRIESIKACLTSELGRCILLESQYLIVPSFQKKITSYIKKSKVEILIANKNKF